jgi:G3E family GTPase
LNKTDLCAPAELDRLEARIRAMNRFAALHRTQNCALDVAHLLNIRAFDLHRALEIDPQFLAETDHQHDATVTSVSLDIPGDLDGERLNGWLSTLLRERGADIFRMKGILSIRERQNQFVFQGVHMLFDGTEGRPWGTTPRGNKLVFIGRKLDREELSRGFRSCLA